MREIKKPVCGVLGVSVPIDQAPNGSATTRARVAAASNSGALGIVSGTERYSDEIRRMIPHVRQTDRLRLWDKPRSQRVAEGAFGDLSRGGPCEGRHAVMIVR
jgi:NAD(P)H-dependent flavin oxidoreductase YrpB (nitropropane dioxygenase family)